MKTTFVLAVLVCVGLTVHAQYHDLYCDNCVRFFTAIEHMVQNGVPLDKVERDAKALCAIIPQPMETYCEDTLLPEVEKIYNEANSTSPQEICLGLDACQED
ncbi:uncharacterized protein [Diabrotica undecimpunctata]|uniref:uncharacterized protein n=1 Tax=Diabrotica undecimpunctata TaxID=50387 RepID=UPI003B6380FD